MDGMVASSGTWIPAAFSAFGGFATAALSYFLLRKSDATKDERTYQREQAARNEARRDAIIERRNELQRQTMFDLQDAVYTLVQACYAYALKDRTSTEWEAIRFDLKERMRVGHASTAKLRVRIRDAEIRQQLSTLKSGLIEIEDIVELEERRKAFLRLVPITQQLEERIRLVLEQMDEVELAE